MGGTSTGLSKFTMDEQTHIARGSSESTFEITEGTGRYANLRGHGTVKSQFNGDNATGQWTVTVTGFEKRASTQ